jgi:hypothetical protein
MKAMDPTLVAQLVVPADARLAAHSNTPVQWRCPVDPRHVWSASPNTRSRSRGCPVCLNKIVIAGVNDLATTHPELAAQVSDPQMATRVHAGSHRSIEWVCPDHPEHRWSASVVSRLRRGSGCPYCSGRIPVVGVNDLASTHPDLAAQLVDPDLARTVGAGSSKKLWWRCPDDPEHVWEASVRNRAGSATRKPSGCPQCAHRGRRSPARLPTLAKINSPLLNEAVDPVAAGALSCGSGLPVAWWCPVCGGGHQYLADVRHRMRGQGCPVLAGTQVMAGVNDLATTHPQLAAQLVDQSLATVLSRGSVTPVQWRCDKSHVWTTPAYARVAGNNCPQCCPIGSSYQEESLWAAVRALDPQARHRVNVSPGDGHGLEIDVVSGRLGIEFNGVYWHSEAAGRTRSYHRDKLSAAHRRGYDLVGIWEDDWANPLRRTIIMRALAHRLHRPDRLGAALAAAGCDLSVDPTWVEHLGARRLRVGEISGPDASQFFEHHHLQGSVVLTRALALIDGQDRPRAVLGLRSPRHNARAHREPGQWEIQRYATAGVIPGGFTRLLAHAEQMLQAEDVALTEWVTLSDDEWSNGALYRACGFTVDDRIPPSYWYAGGPCRGVRHPKEAFQLRRFRTDPALTFTEGWTEHEAAAANHLYRVWDAGRTRWVRPVE